MQNVNLTTQTNGEEKSYSCTTCIEYDMKLQIQADKYQNMRQKNEKLAKEIIRLKKLLKFYTGKYFSTSHRDGKKKSCQVCFKLLTPEELKTHLCMDQQEIICEYCSRSFKTTIEFGDHLSEENHSKTTLYRCDKCALGFPASLLLKYHQESDMSHPDDVARDIFDLVEPVMMCSTVELPSKIVHKDVVNRFECYICKKTFRNQRYMRQHSKLHAAALDQKCAICNECLTSNELDWHVCRSNRSIACDYCDITFNATSRLLQHLETAHDGGILYKCRKCPQFFGTINLRHIHEECHDVSPKPKPFICEICSKAFADRMQLKIHSVTHLMKRTVTLHCLYLF